MDCFENSAGSEKYAYRQLKTFNRQWNIYIQTLKTVHTGSENVLTGAEKSD